MHDRRWRRLLFCGVAGSALGLAGCAGYGAYPPYSAPGSAPYPYGYYYPYETFGPPQSVFVVPERSRQVFVPRQQNHVVEERREERQERESRREERHETPQQERQEEHAEHDHHGR